MCARWLLLLSALAFASPLMAADAMKPNILYVLCDDLGYGDLQCLNPQGKIPTPNFDRLAAEGMKFTDAHSGSAVCTPTRYGVLTGRYSWRTRLQSFVLGGLSTHLIEPSRMTVASLLKSTGYTTACIGKWHLGVDWAIKDPAYHPADTMEKGPEGWKVDFTQPLRNGPTSVGFDTYFGISASLDMVPYTYIENDRVTEVPTVERVFPMMSGREGKNTRPGPGTKEFQATEVLPTFTQKTVEFIERQSSGHPFFLYLPLNAPHTPIAPTAEWLGKSGLNPYGDFVMETDAMLGRILDALDRTGLAKETLIFLTSDNGCSPNAKYDELLPKGHNPSAQFRGTKADIFEGGHRVPFLVRWPAKIHAGSQSDQTICLTDLLATCAEMVGAKVPPDAGEDSVSLLPILLGTAKTPVREAVVHHSINGSFAIRQGSWKLELCADSGGWSAPRPGSAAAKKLPPSQLYDMSSDEVEQTNVAAQHPEVVERLETLLRKYIAEGRSTPGAPQKNDAPIELRKTTETAAAE